MKMSQTGGKQKIRSNPFLNPFLRVVLIVMLWSCIGGLGAMFVLVVYIVESLVRPKRKTRFDLYTLTPHEWGLPAEEVFFAPLSGDYQVSGWYIPHPHATTTIVVCPGYRCRVDAVLGLLPPLWRAGHTILVFEYYGHGAPVGKAITLGYREINDFLGAISYAKARTPQTHLGILAYSMGASIALMGSVESNDVEALVVDSPFATHRSAVAYSFNNLLHLPFAPLAWIIDCVLWSRAGYRFHQVEPLRYIGRIAPRPILLIHGEQDSIVDPQDAHLLYAAAGEPKELWLLPSVDHCCAYFANRRLYMTKVCDFFSLHLKSTKQETDSDKESTSHKLHATELRTEKRTPELVEYLNS